MLYVVLVIAAIAFWAMLESVLPHHRRHWLPRLGRACAGLWQRIRRRRDPSPDPFDALRVQTRLGALAHEIGVLESSGRVFAKRHHLLALQAAYDDLLEEGCRLAGVTVGDGEPADSRRWREEQELAERGWSW